MKDAFLSQTMERHGDAVYRLALCRLQSVEDAEDVYQDTFLQLFQSNQAETWDDEHLKAWLLRVAVNKCTDTARRRKRQRTLSLEDVGELSAADVYAYTELWDAVRKLPEKQRVIFHLFYEEGYQTQEISQILHLPGATVRVNLSRARKNLKKELEGYVSCV